MLSIMFKLTHIEARLLDLRGPTETSMASTTDSTYAWQRRRVLNKKAFLLSLVTLTVLAGCFGMGTHNFGHLSAF